MSEKNKVLENLPFIKNILTMAIIIGLIVSVCNYLLNPVKQTNIKMSEINTGLLLLQNQVVNLKDNHLAHMEKEITEIKETDIKQDEKLDEMNNNIIKLLTIIQGYEQ